MKKALTTALALSLGAAMALTPPAIHTAWAEDNVSAAASGSDEYMQYQWAFHNDGKLRRTEHKLNIKALNEIYLHYGENGTDSISLPPLGPSDYDSISTNAVPGIDINVEEAWQLYEQTENKRPVTIALIDTGVDTSHPDLNGAIWVNEDEIPDDGIDNDGNGYVDDVNGWNFISNNNQLCAGEEDSHGTHGAGTIAGVKGNGGITGIADSSYVKIMVLKALGGKDGMGTPESVVAAIHYAEANGAQICNLSFGSGACEPNFEAAIRDSGMLFIVASGNGNKYEIGYDIDKYPVYPASLPYDNVMTVGNLMFNGWLDESSNYGTASVDIAAPGTYILSTIPGNAYAFMSGTSMAAPMVTGAAAMLYSSHPQYSVQDVKNVLLASAHKLAPLKGRLYSSGMLDVSAAMKWGK